MAMMFYPYHFVASIALLLICLILHDVNSRCGPPDRHEYSFAEKRWAEDSLKWKPFTCKTLIAECNNSIKLFFGRFI
jgi:hypothetical protein